MTWRLEDLALPLRQPEAVLMLRHRLPRYDVAHTGLTPRAVMLALMQGGD